MHLLGRMIMWLADYVACMRDQISGEYDVLKHSRIEIRRLVYSLPTVVIPQLYCNQLV